MPQKEQEIRLLLGGDTMLGRGVNQVIHEQGPDYPLESLYSVSHSADLFFVNLECAISATDKQFTGAPKAFYFRADPPALRTLTGAGVDLVNLANNHALDAAEVGLENTLEHLAQAGITTVGAGRDLDQAREPAVVTAAGLRIGVLGACDHQPDFAAEADRPGIRYLDLRRGQAAPLLQDVRALAAQVDLVVVALHWQPNWVPQIPSQYRQLASDLVQAGADVIWGHSPHHFQGVEWFDGAAALYATGDLVDDYAVDERYRNDLQLLFELRLAAGRVAGVRALPLRLRYACTEPAAGEDHSWIAARFDSMCAEVGSRSERDGDWLVVEPR